MNTTKSLLLYTFCTEVIGVEMKEGLMEGESGGDRDGKNQRKRKGERRGGGDDKDNSIKFWN